MILASISAGIILVQIGVHRLSIDLYIRAILPRFLPAPSVLLFDLRALSSVSRQVERHYSSSSFHDVSPQRRQMDSRIAAT